jgi:hypothetical protein
MKYALIFVMALSALPASAEPITAGRWSATAAPTLEGNKSEDDCATGPHMCAAVWSLPAATEVLTGGFGYNGWAGATLFSQMTDYNNAPGLSWDGQSFAYDNGHGFTSSSWGGVHQRLYRQVAADSTRYWLAIEDMPNPIIPDWNDAIYSWNEAGSLQNSLLPVVPAPVPEPATICLVAGGLALLTRKRARLAALASAIR